MNFKFLLVSALSLGALTACSDDSSDDVNNGGGNNITTPETETKTRTYFNVVAGIDVESSSGSTYAGAFGDLSSPSTSITFKGWGFNVPSVRTAYVYASQDGKSLYNLSYGGGTIHKFNVLGGQNYTQVKELDVSLAMGTNNPRWTKMTEEYASLHNVSTTLIEENGVYSHHKAVGTLTGIRLADFTIITDYHEGGGANFEFPRTSEDEAKSLHVWRIDAPVLHNGKAYYGLNKRTYNANTASNVSTSDYSSSTLIIDFPEFTNPKIITSTIAKGSTQGYRTPVSHVDEKGDVYQMSAAPSHILKISNEEYDNSYDFDLSALLGINAGANGWFYVGNGIGYVPYYDIDKGIGSDAASWGVARVDLYNKSIVKMNLPEGLWLQQYQYGVIGNDGLFYMAIAPLGQDGNIYMLDPKSEDPNGFTVGATILAIDSSSAYLGVF